MSEINVSAGQALNGLQAAFKKDSIQQEGQIAMQLIDSASTAQQGSGSDTLPSPTERMGQNINIKA